MAQYGSVSYWDSRYEAEDYLFDWYQKWSGIKEIVKKEVKKSDRVLIVGCGRSRLSEEMSKDGYTDILSTDASKTCIAANQKQYGSKLRFEVLDITDMSCFSHGEFDAVIDKGCLDCLLCGDNSTERTLTALKHISRVLRPGGVYISISYGAPMFRTNYMSRPEFSWDVSVFGIPKPSRKPDVPVEITPLHPTANTADIKEACHYIYICRRTTTTTGDYSKTFDSQESRRAPEDDNFAYSQESFNQQVTGESQLDRGQSGAAGDLTADNARQTSQQFMPNNSITSMDDETRRLASGVTSKRWERKQISAQPLYDLDGQTDD